MNAPLMLLDAQAEIKTVWECFEKAIKRFNNSTDQKTLLGPRNEKAKRGAAASERAITHRLAFYLESELRASCIISDESSLTVDCEYNRHGGALKAVAVEAKLKGIVEEARNKKWDEPDDDGFYVFSVAPDIIVHQRGNDWRNRLVIEVKKATNRETPEYDALKLSLFTGFKHRDEGYGYDLGAWVIADDLRAPQDRKLRIEARYEGGTKK